MTTPYYEDATVQLHHGDCLDVLRGLPDNSVDSVVTDPPYNLSFMSKAWDHIDGEPIDPAFMHWLAGFIDGEGCFSVHKKPQNTYDCQFSIALRADDRPILERIHRTLGMGTLSKPTAHRTGPDNPKARWSVSKKSDLVRLRDLLRAFPLRAKKATDFEIWSDALDAWVDHKVGEWDDVAALRKLLMEGRAYTDEGVRVDPFQMWCWRWGRECLRILKPGGHVLSFGGTRTFHRLASGLEDAGFEIRDSLAWLQGAGFPKSLNVGNAIDRTRCVEAGTHSDTRDHVCPQHSDADEWRGHGTALKPAHEPVVVARKPLSGTVASNVLAWGTGALNVDGCRIDMGSEYDSAKRQRQQRSDGDVQFASAGLVGTDIPTYNPAGRWPANVVLDESQAAELDQQSGECSHNPPATWRGGTDATEGWGNVGKAEPGQIRSGFGDSGGASRFFYVAKADAGERVRVAGIAHPTVKPLALMRWLVRLVTPPGGTVLEPFAGSGTTVEACILEGFHCLAIEREADYLPLIVQRINRRRDPVAYYRAAGGQTLDATTIGAGNKVRACRVCGSRGKPAGGEQSGKPWPTCGHDDWHMVGTLPPRDAQGDDAGLFDLLDGEPA